ncbi:hypothetical protein GCM10009830_02700 [Glycomyces endophyticus]|uniref:Uncharacterized protein n=1 Tax=Glycomyces endophyticus TaxID=480996 RepID=A0ABP4RUU9_9ACTN
MTHPNPHHPNQGPGMTEEEAARHRSLNLAGAALLVVPLLAAVLLSAVEAPIDPKFTAPVIGAVMIAGAGMLGQARRLRRDAARR